MKIRLNELAQARSGDKGNSINIGVFAHNEAIYEMLLEKLTPEAVRAHFAESVHGEVVRYELPTILGMNFVLREALDGGGSSTLRMDNLGKCFGAHLLRMEIEMDHIEMR